MRRCIMDLAIKVNNEWRDVGTCLKLHRNFHLFLANVIITIVMYSVYVYSGVVIELTNDNCCSNITAFFILNSVHF